MDFDNFVGELHGWNNIWNSYFFLTKSMIDSLKKQMVFLDQPGLVQDFKESANKFIKALFPETSLLSKS